jgi:hypothetical protein
MMMMTISSSVLDNYIHVRAHTALAHKQVSAADAAASDVIVRLDNRHKRSASFSDQVLLRLEVLARMIIIFCCC